MGKSVAAKKLASKEYKIPKKLDKSHESSTSKIASDESFCGTCKVECLTADKLYTHTQGMMHIMRAQAQGDIEELKKELNAEKKSNIPVEKTQPERNQPGPQRNQLGPQRNQPGPQRNQSGPQRGRMQPGPQQRQSRPLQGQPERGHQNMGQNLRKQIEDNFNFGSRDCPPNGRPQFDPYDDYRQPFDNDFSCEGPAFHRDDIRRPPFERDDHFGHFGPRPWKQDDFGGPPMKRSNRGSGHPEEFGRGRPDDFGRGHPDDFGHGRPDDFGYGPPDHFEYGPPDHFGRGRGHSGDFGRGCGHPGDFGRGRGHPGDFGHSPFQRDDFGPRDAIDDIGPPPCEAGKACKQMKNLQHLMAFTHWGEQEEVKEPEVSYDDMFGKLKVPEVHENDDDDDMEEAGTYCRTCHVECHTADKLYTHTQGMMHIMRAQAQGDILKEGQKKRKIVPMEHKKPAIALCGSDETDPTSFFCYVCNYDLRTASKLKSHKFSMGHINKLEMQQPGEMQEYKHQQGRPNARDIAEPQLTEREAYEQSLANEFRCELCTVTLASEFELLEGHNKGAAHKKRQRTKDWGGGIYPHTDGLKTRPVNKDPTFQFMESDSREYKDSQIGLEYIYEIHRATTIGPPYYACLVCDEGHFDCRSHITSKEHKKNYFMKHFIDHEDILYTVAPGVGTEFYLWFKRTYLKTKLWMDFELGAKLNRPALSMETNMLKHMTAKVNRKQGPIRINVHEEIRGSYVRPPGTQDTDEFLNIPAVQKFNAKRIVVGNLPKNVTDIKLMDFINHQLILRPVVDCEILQDKRVAFLTFRSYEDATMCLLLNGIYWVDEGIELQIARPNNYIPLPNQDDLKMLRECEIPPSALLYNQTIQQTGGKHTDNIFMKGVPHWLTKVEVLNFVNRHCIGTPAVDCKLNKTSDKERGRGEKDAIKSVFVSFRCSEEVERAVVCVDGLIWGHRIVSAARPTNYQPLPNNNKQGEKRQHDHSDIQPLYTDFHKMGRVDARGLISDGFRGGSGGFVKAGSTQEAQQHYNQPYGYPQHQQQPSVAQVPAPRPARWDQSAQVHRQTAGPSQALLMLKEVQEVLDNDTICTDEEATAAQQVANQLSSSILVFHQTRGQGKFGEANPRDISGKPTQDDDIETWMNYMKNFLDKGRLVSDEDAKLAKKVTDTLSEEVRKYQARCAPAVESAMDTSQQYNLHQTDYNQTSYVHSYEY